MSRAPDIAYQFALAKDVAGGTLISVSRNVNTAAAATFVQSQAYTVPGDKVLVICALTAAAQPGAGQIAQTVQAAYRIGNVNVPLVFGPSVQNAVANLQVHANFQGEAWAPPTAVVTAFGGFDAGVNNNTVIIYLSGLLLPRGNFQLG